MDLVDSVILNTNYYYLFDVLLAVVFSCMSFFMPYLSFYHLNYRKVEAIVIDVFLMSNDFGGGSEFF